MNRLTTRQRRASSRRISRQQRLPISKFDGILVMIIAALALWSPHVSRGLRGLAGESLAAAPVTTPKEPKKAIAVLVQGPADGLKTWTDRFGILSNPAFNKTFSADIKLIYASFDRPVSLADGGWMCDGNANLEGFSCKSSFVPNSTWTEGRNALTRLAWCDENQEDFLYWAFFDDDVDWLCPDVGDGLPCWNKYFSMLEVAASYDVPYVAGQPYVSQHGMFRAATNFDAAANAIHHDYVTRILPYAYLPVNTSQWHSQAVQFHLLNTCFKEMSIAFPGIRIINPAHRPYVRGLNATQVDDLTQKNYQQYVPFIGGTDIYQHNGQGTLPNWTDLADHLQQRHQIQLERDPDGVCEQGLTERFFNFLNRKNGWHNDRAYDVCDPLPYEVDYM